MQTPFFVDNEVILLNDRGVWIADDYEITHEPTRRLFAKSLFWDPGIAAYYLKIGRETKKIEVKDTAYFVERIEQVDAQIKIHLNDDIWEELNLDSLNFKDGRLTCEISRRGRSEQARFLSVAYYDLLKNLEEEDGKYLLKTSSKVIKFL